MNRSLGLDRSLLAIEGPNLQSGLRRAIIAAIAARRLQPDQQMPPSRVLAVQLGIARNTVTAVYEDLATRGFLTSVTRRGFFVTGQVTDSLGDAAPPKQDEDVHSPDWTQRMAVRVSGWRHITKPADWQSYRFPFVYGQVDPEFFPLAAWRSASRDALGRAAVNWWAADNTDQDDPLLIEQIRSQILPRRGILARPNEVLITLGAQEGLYLLSRLLVRSGDVVGMENPGYTDARHIFSLSAGALRDLPVDKDGVRTGPVFDGVNLAVVTPSRHCPTGVPLSDERRAWLLDWASRADGLLIEDDYEGEMVADNSLTAMKASDGAGRVIYLGTFSKIIAPGMRLGYMVGPSPLIAEVRALRRLMHRSPPLNNQRLTALFMVEGHYQGLVRQLRGEIQRRHERAMTCLAQHLPDLETSGGAGGSSIWLRCPSQVRGEALTNGARARGVLFEDGAPFFSAPPQHKHLRLGLSAIAVQRIGPGIEALADAMDEAC